MFQTSPILGNCSRSPPANFLRERLAWIGFLFWPTELNQDEHRIYLYDGTIPYEGIGVVWKFMVSIRGSNNAVCFTLFPTQLESKLGDYWSDWIYYASHSYYWSLVSTRVTKIFDRVKQNNRSERMP